MWARQQGVLTASTRSYSAQGALAYTPIAELLRSEMVHKRLSLLDTIWLSEVARLLPEILAARPDLPQPEPISASWQRPRFFEALARALLVDEQLLLFLFDDLQWCDRETLDWLQYLLNFAPQVRLLVVGTVRDEEVGTEHPLTTLCLQLQRTGQMTEIKLAPLSQGEAIELAIEVAGEDLTMEQTRQLYRATEGNPLFVVEMVRARTNQEITGHGPVEPAFVPIQKDDVPLPPKIHAVIRSRLSHLSSQAQDLASLAAVIGRSFTLEVVAMASHQDEETLVNSLDELWQRQIIREGDGDRYDFSHDKIREVAYAGMSRVRRRLLHHRVAEALARIHGSDSHEISGQLAAHYEQAGEPAQAVQYYQQAGEAARQVSAYEDAIALFTRARQLLAMLPENLARDAQELNLLRGLEIPLVVARGYAAPEVRQIYEQSLVLAKRLEQRPEAPILWALALAHLTGGAPQQAHRLGQQLLDLAQEDKDPAQHVEAHYLMGVSSFWMGAFIASRTHLQEAVAHYDPQWHRRNIDLYAHDSGPICLVRLAFTLWVLGYSEQALAQSRAALALVQAQKHLFGLTYVHGYSAWLYREWGELSLAAKENEAMLSLCSQHGISFWPPMGWIVRGGLLVAKGEIHLGLAEIERGLIAFESEELNLQRPYVLAVAAQAYATAGQRKQGLVLVEAGLSASQQTKEHFWDAELHRLRGLLLLAGETTAADEAEVAFQHALIVAAEQGAKSLELRAALGLARLWQAQGRPNAAYVVLAPIYNWFSEGFATPVLREARALLELLA